MQKTNIPAFHSGCVGDVGMGIPNTIGRRTEGAGLSPGPKFTSNLPIGPVLEGGCRGGNDWVLNMGEYLGGATPSATISPNV